MQQLFKSTWVVGCIPHPTNFSPGRTGMRLHTPGLRPRYAGCTGMPPCIHQDCIRHHLKFRPSVPGCFTRYEKLMQRIWESNFNSTWVVGCIPHPTDFNTGRTGMRLHTPGLRPRCAGCTGMRNAYTRTASRHHWMHWHALAYTRTASGTFCFLFFELFFFFHRHARAPHRI